MCIPSSLLTIILNNFSFLSLIEVKDEVFSPIDGAEVILSSKYGDFINTADELGVVKFEVPTANYKIKVFKEGYLPYEGSLDLSEPQL